LANFNGPELPVDQFPIVKKYFFMTTKNIKGFLFQHHKAHGCFSPSDFQLQRNFNFVPKIAIFKVLGAGPNVLLFYKLAIGNVDENLSF
jgi:hypothetical protein